MGKMNEQAIDCETYRAKVLLQVVAGIAWP